MNTKRTFAMITVLMMLSIACVCVFIPQDGDGSEPTNSPIVKIESPEDGSKVGLPLKVTMTVKHADALYFKLNDSDWATMGYDPSKEHYAVSVMKLKEGKNVIEVKATDDKTESTDSISVYYEKGVPVFEEMTPEPTEPVTDCKFTVSGVVKGAIRLTVALNGGAENEVEIEKDFSFSTVVTLVEGKNTIVVRAYGESTDGITEITINVTYDKKESFWDTPGNIAGTAVLAASILALLALIMFERTRKF